MLGFRYVTGTPRLSSLDSFQALFRFSWRLCLTDRPNDFLEGVIGDLNDLIVGPVLDRMWNENARGFESQGFRLRFRGFNKFGAGDVGARNTAAFQVGDVMQTARRAAPSIRQRFNYHIALRADKLLQIHRRDSRKGRLRVALDLHPVLD